MRSGAASLVETGVAYSYSPFPRMSAPSCRSLPPFARFHAITTRSVNGKGCIGRKLMMSPPAARAPMLASALRFRIVPS
jgi:hypothetical protein